MDLAHLWPKVETSVCGRQIYVPSEWLFSTVTMPKQCASNLKLQTVQSNLTFYSASTRVHRKAELIR